jgi:hypothetical protein
MPQTMNELMQGNTTKTITVAEKIAELKSKSRTFRLLHARYEPNATAEERKLSTLLEGYFLTCQNVDSAYFFRAFSQILSSPPTTTALPQWLSYFYSQYFSDSAKYSINVSGGIRQLLDQRYGPNSASTNPPYQGIDFNSFVGDMVNVVHDMAQANDSITARYMSIRSGQDRAERIRGRIRNQQHIDSARTEAKNQHSYFHPLDRRRAGKKAAAAAKKSNNRDFDQYVFKLWKFPLKPMLLEQRGRNIDEATLDVWAKEYLGGDRAYQAPELNEQE